MSLCYFLCFSIAIPHWGGGVGRSAVFLYDKVIPLTENAANLLRLLLLIRWTGKNLKGLEWYWIVLGAF